MMVNSAAVGARRLGERELRSQLKVAVMAG
jgi:hypothetical protein